MLSDDGMILVFLDSKDSGIKRIQEKFWINVHDVNFNENTAEDIIDVLLNENIEHEIIEFSSHMDLGKLQNVMEDGIVSLLIPFTFRTHEIKKEVVEEVISYIKTLERDRKIENKTFAIIIKK